MKRPTTVRRVAAPIAAAALAVVTMLGAPAGSATTQSRWDSVDGARAVERELGADAAGFYLDRQQKKMVVNISDRSDASEVRQAGAIPRKVDNSGAELAKVTRALSRSAAVDGSAWGVDPATNTVLVSLDESVGARELARVKDVTRRFKGKATIERVTGEFTTRISGGEAILGGGSRCSLGFNVTDGSADYFLTAGHCTNIASSWTTGSGAFIGPTVGSSFPGNDYGIVRHDGGVAHPGDVYLYPGSQDITFAASAFVGEHVVRSGSTTGVHDGFVQATNVTVNYPEGQVGGLIQTDVCAEPGDSGGSLFDGSAAIGLTSGGSGNCTFGGTTFFQPVTEPLSVYGVSVY